MNAKARTSVCVCVTSRALHTSFSKWTYVYPTYMYLWTERARDSAKQQVNRIRIQGSLEHAIMTQVFKHHEPQGVSLV